MKNIVNWCADAQCLSGPGHSAAAAPEQSASLSAGLFGRSISLSSYETYKGITDDNESYECSLSAHSPTDGHKSLVPPNCHEQYNKDLKETQKGTTNIQLLAKLTRGTKEY